MGNYRKASRRLVNPEAQDYKERVNADGKTERVLCGPYSLEQRDAYFKVMMDLHSTRHPELKHGKVKQAVFQKWRMMVIAHIQDRAKKLAVYLKRANGFGVLR